MKKGEKSDEGQVCVFHVIHPPTPGAKSNDLIEGQEEVCKGGSRLGGLKRAFIKNPRISRLKEGKPGGEERKFSQGGQGFIHFILGIPMKFACPLKGGHAIEKEKKEEIDKLKLNSCLLSSGKGTISDLLLKRERERTIGGKVFPLTNRAFCMAGKAPRWGGRGSPE